MVETVKHTPGPWGISEDGNWLQQNGGLSALVNGRYLSICVSATSEHDKNLICAAPDLLKAATRILDRGYVSESIEEERDDHLLLAAAISKASGRQP